MYPDDGIYFNSGRYEERRIDISGGIGDVTRKRLLEKRASNRRNRPRECLVTLFDTRPSKLHGRAVASYPSRVTINMHINTQPSYNPPWRRFVPSFLLESYEKCSQRFPLSFTKGMVEDLL